MRAQASSSGSNERRARAAGATPFLRRAPRLALVLLLAVGAWSGCDAWQARSRSHGKGEWSYAGETGPDSWADLDDAYSLCREGRAQSPVDLLPDAVVDAHPSSLRLEYGLSVPTVINTGRGLQVAFEGRHSASVDGAVYWLHSLRMRTPSEHTLGGRRFPAELQLRHETDDGWVAFVAVLVREGRAHPELAAVLDRADLATGEQMRLAATALNLESLLPERRILYRYDGSLPFPPCSEAVRWFVFDEPIELSAAQIELLRSVAPDNSRPVQALNDRSIELGLRGR